MLPKRKFTLLFVQNAYFSTLSRLEMQLKIAFTLLITTCSTSVYAGLDPYNVGAAPAGMANAYLSQSSLWSLAHNPAGLGWCKTAEAGTFYENRFLMRATSVQAIAGMMPTKTGTFGLQYAGMGFSAYREHQLRFGYGIELTPKFSAGIGMNWSNVRIAGDYGNRSVISADVGIQYKVTKELTMAARVANLSRSKLNDYDTEFVPVVLSIGGHFQFSEHTLLSFQAEKDMMHKPTFRLGFEYHPSEFLYIRAGIASNPMLNAFGIGLKLQQFRFDMACSYHRWLGFTPQASLIYSFAKKD
jgi:hypothetical protein